MKRKYKAMLNKLKKEFAPIQKDFSRVVGKNVDLIMEQLAAGKFLEFVILLNKLEVTEDTDIGWDGVGNYVFPDAYFIDPVIDDLNGAMLHLPAYAQIDESAYDALIDGEEENGCVFSNLPYDTVHALLGNADDDDSLENYKDEFESSADAPAWLKADVSWISADHVVFAALYLLSESNESRDGCETDDHRRQADDAASAALGA